MSRRAGVVSRLAQVLVLALLGTMFLGVMNPVHAQNGSQDAPLVHGVVGDIGSGWLVALQSATLTAIPLSQTAPNQQQMLRVTLQVQNAGAEARLFPLSRLRLVDGSGAPLRDTWCGRDSSPLELSGQLPPKGSLTGDVCWAVDTADVAGVVLIVDPPLEERGQQPALFAVGPIESAVARVAPTPAAAAPISSTSAVAAVSPAAPPLPPLSPEAPPPAATATPPSVTGATNVGSLAGPTYVGCARPYSAYADAQGSYLTAGCPVAERSREGSGAALRLPGVPASDLYPSANQPSTRNSPSFGPTPTPGAAPTALTAYGTLTGINSQNR